MKILLIVLLIVFLAVIALAVAGFIAIWRLCCYLYND